MTLEYYCVLLMVLENKKLWMWKKFSHNCQKHLTVQISDQIKPYFSSLTKMVEALRFSIHYACQQAFHTGSPKYNPVRFVLLYFLEESSNWSGFIDNQSEGLFAIAVRIGLQFMLRLWTCSRWIPAKRENVAYGQNCTVPVCIHCPQSF